MNNELLEFISNNSSPESRDTFKTVFEILETFNIEDYINPFNDAYSCVDNSEVDSIIFTFFNIAENQLVNILNSLGIFVTDETNLQELVSILEHISLIEDYEDKKAIKDIIQSDLSNEETLMTILELVGSLSADDFSNSITIVNPGFIKKIKEIIEGDSELDEIVDIDAVRNKVANLKTLLKNCEIEYSIIHNELQNNLSINLEFDLYKSIFQDKLLKLYNKEQYKQLAFEIVLMFIISKDKADNIPFRSREYVSNNFSDIDLNNKLLNEVGNILPKLF